MPIPISASSQQHERDALTTRIIPTMTLSTASNPLTKPLGPIETESISERAAGRFAVEGNVVVTGGAGALGLASAKALLEHGASVLAILDLPATLKSSNSQIQELKTQFSNRRIGCFPVDVASPETVEEIVSHIATEFFAVSPPTVEDRDDQNGAGKVGGIDILCCFAGIVNCTPSISLSMATFSKVLDVNLQDSFICAQAVAKHMIKQNRGGSILFTASISAHHTNFPQPQVAYNVSKAAVKHLTTNLAVEWAVHGIRVNCISPGYMDTVLNAGDNLKLIRDMWADNNPIGRMGDVEEITGPTVMLCSKRAGRYITGIDILVDGGAMCL